MLRKTQPKIDYQNFYKLVQPVATFNSLRGKKYKVIGLEGNIMHFTRESNKKWKMDLSKLHKAYLELTDFKTVNFKPYVPLTHSPALGLLLYLKLLM